MKYKIYIPHLYHHKNEEFIRYYANYFTIVNKLEDADIVFSSSTSYPAEKYPNKKFIFGPHFSVLPNDAAKNLNNNKNNAVYLFPSKQALNVWKNDFKFDNIRLVCCPFGVNTEKFKTRNVPKKEVFVYYKKRNPEELEYVKEFLKKNKIQFTLIAYGKYTEEQYIQQLWKAKFGIWIGEHESQGFALQEALSMNVPLLVWSTTKMNQEWGSTKYENIKEKMETAYYWDHRCGEKFYNQCDFEKTFQLFIRKLDTYKPREFIVENLSYEACTKKFNKILNDFGLKI